MAHRNFVAPDGRRWDAWDVPGRDPATVPGLSDALKPAVRDGWLCFESDGDKRRLIPAPARWEERSDQELWLYCRVAERVEGRRAPFAAKSYT